MNPAHNAETRVRAALLAVAAAKRETEEIARLPRPTCRTDVLDRKQRLDAAVDRERRAGLELRSAFWARSLIRAGAELAGVTLPAMAA